MLSNSQLLPQHSGVFKHRSTRMDNVASLLAQLGYKYHLSAVNLEGITAFQVWREVSYKVGTNPELRLKFVCEDQDAATALTIALQHEEYIRHG